MKSILNIITRPIKAASGAFERFPVATIYLFVLFVIFSLLFQFENIADNLAFALVTSCLFGVVVNLAFSVLEERLALEKKYNLIFLLSGIILPLLLFLMLNFFTLDDIVKARVIAIILCLGILFLLIPAYKSKKFNFNNVFMISTKSSFISLIYGIVLMVGLIFIAFSIKALLWSNMSEKVFGHLSIFSGFVASVFYLGYFPFYNDDEEDTKYQVSNKYSIFAEVLISYILIPVITAFTFVFLGYATKILITWNWPSNQFALYAALYALIGLYAFILSAALDNSFCRFYRKWFPRILIPVLFLQAIAIFIRISAYGLTERRYFAIVFWVFSMFCAFLFTIKTINKSKFSAFVAICLILFSILPIVNYYDVSVFSQTIRAEGILKANNMLENGGLKPNPNLANDEQKKLIDIVSYLSTHNKNNQITWLPKAFDMSKFKEYFGFSGGENIINEKYYYYNYVLENVGYPIKGYDIAVNGQKDFNNGVNVETATFNGSKGSYNLAFTNNNNTGKITVTLKQGEKSIIQADLDHYVLFIKNELSKLSESNTNNPVKGNEIKVPFEKMNVVLEGNGIKLLIVFNAITRQQTPNMDGSPVDTLDFNARYYIAE
jgi:hypothetical protein